MYYIKGMAVIPRRKFRGILQNQWQKMSKVESSFNKIVGVDSKPGTLVTKIVHQGFCGYIRIFSSSSVRSNTNFVFGRTAACTLQGRNFIKTLSHHKFFQDNLFKMASLRNNF